MIFNRKIRWAAGVGAAILTVSGAEYFTPDERWQPVDVSRIVVQPGSALDLYPEPDGPAGQFGRVIVNGRGRLAFEQRPEQTVRFKGFSSGLDEGVWRRASDAQFKAKADELVRAMRRQGYNYFRMHGIDRWITTNNRGDLEITDKFRDRWNYLQYAMKREGIYVQPVMLSFALYGSSADYRATYDAREMHKVMFYLGREWEMERFRFAVENLLNRVNPYTGMKWKDDPAVAVVETYNESFLGMQRLDRVKKTHPQEFAIYLKAWQDWYAARHGGRRPASEELPGSNSPDAGEYMMFQFELIKNTIDRCTRILREAGYRGIVTQNSSHRMFSTAAAWESLAAVDNHGYFCHPSKWSQPGSVVRQDSAAGLGAMIFRRAAGERLPDRPMLMGEYNHAYWNRYQYEMPLTFDAYAALQDFSVLCIHEYPAMLKFDRFVSSFYIVNNPVQRAGEFLAHMLFQRGDVSPSPHLVTVAIPDRYWQAGGRGLKALGAEQTKAALLTGFGVEFPQLKPYSRVAFKPDLRVAPGGTAGIFTHSGYSEVIEEKNDGRVLDRLVGALRRRGVLAPGNRTDAASGVFESDTGELLMRTREKMVQVVTPRTEAVALPAGQQARLDRLEVLKVTTSGCVALTSVSGEPLDRADRLVLIYSTCVANSGMRLSSDRSTMIRRGETPVLLETGRLELEFRTAGAEQFELYALRMDGSRSEKLPLAVRDGKLAIRIDTAKLAAGPTVFFELVKKK